MEDIAGSSVAQFSCQYFDPLRCDPAKTPCEHVEKCKESKGMQMACYSVWANDSSNSVKLSLKGCWLAQEAEHNNCNQDKCVAEKPTKTKLMGIESEESTYFCCCNKPMCNERFEYLPPSSKPANNHGKGTPVTSTGPDAANVFIYVFVPVIAIASLILLGYFVYRRFKLRTEAKRMISLHTNGFSNSPNGPSSPSIPLKSIQLTDMIAKGRYGMVWKAKMGENNHVAVKIFPVQDVESWSQEQDIYGVPGLRQHPNILRFFGAEVRGSGVQAKYWLITELQENGSLHDYLKAHTVTLVEFLRISTGMLRGLVFLHEESTENGHCYKPAVVHRDIKSKNVLLNKDLNACIADFGLAVKCVQGRTPNDVHAQVGTRRYMSPEVLEGATDFNALAFRQIDVYAAALVLWEVLSRCTFFGEVGEYRLPYEDVGLKPTLLDLQEYVAVKQERPKMKTAWRANSHGALICSTIEEMWDKEPDARITAGCALARLTALQENTKSMVWQLSMADETQPQLAERSPLILDPRSQVGMETATV